MGCLIVIIIIGLMLLGMGVNGWVIVLGISALLIISLIVCKNEEIKEKEEKELKEKQEKEAKEQLLIDYSLPIDCKRFRHAGGYNKFPNGRWLYVWRDDKHLNLLSNKESIEKHQISLSNINFYSVKGDVRQETETKGGNATVGETMMAEGLLGTAAAMRKNQAVQNIKTIDERKTIINATIDGKNSFIFFEGADLYKYLLEQIPEKEQSFVAMQVKK